MFKTLAAAVVMAMSAGAAWAAPGAAMVGADLAGSASVALLGSGLVAAGMMMRRRDGLEG